MNIIIDAMGGDNAPAATLLGAAAAVKNLGICITAVGNSAVMQAAVKQHNIDMQNISIHHAPETMEMDEDATNVRKRPNTSLAVALRLLAEDKGDALVSAGSTGAVLVGATLVVKRIKGVSRAALGAVMPSAKNPWILIDCGANTECRPEQLLQFAAMGSAYMQKVMGIKSPIVALANNGAEENKGGPLQQAAFALLKQSGLNFAGNIEGRAIPMGQADVIVCDGFTGNIILKTVEGMAKMMSGKIKEMFYASGKTKIAGLMMKKSLAEFKKGFDYKEFGGAPLLGIKKPVIKAHGSSDAKAFMNAIRQAKDCAAQDVCGTIEAFISAQKSEETPDE